MSERPGGDGLPGAVLHFMNLADLQLGPQEEFDGTGRQDSVTGIWRAAYTDMIDNSANRLRECCYNMEIRNREYR